MGRLSRRFWWFAGIAGAGLAFWALWRVGALNWLWVETHPVRPVVEALSWVAGIVGLVFTAAALKISLGQRQSNPQPADASTTQHIASTAGKSVVEVRDSRGVQIGDHNTQTNNFDQ
ncbi:hypothetical protein ACXIZN_40950 [Amycolatopsis sp. TRM77291]